MLRLPERFSKTILSQPFLKANSRLVSSHQSPQNTEPSDEDLKAARIWLDHLSSKTVPRSICDISYCRSSGPGGQNVNKYVQYNAASRSGHNKLNHTTE